MRRFVLDDGFLKAKHHPHTITRALDLYYSGLGSHRVRGYLRRHHREKVSRMSVHRWARRYGRMVYRYTREFKLDFNGRNLHCDEKIPNVGKENAYLWLMTFGSPHFICEMDLTRRRFKRYAKRMFKKIWKRIESYPPMIVSDGLGHYNACTKYFYRKSKHVVYESFKKWPNNNRLERMNGDIDDWLTRKGFKSIWRAKEIIEGWSVQHNFVERHSRLGITPAEGVGLDTSSRGDVWMQLIKMVAEG